MPRRSFTNDPPQIEETVTDDPPETQPVAERKPFAHCKACKKPIYVGQCSYNTTDGRVCEACKR